MAKVKPTFIDQYDAMNYACEGNEGALRVLMEIRNRAGDTGEWSLGIEWLTWKLGVSRRTIIRRIEWLEERELITSRRKRVTHCKSYGVHWAAVYGLAESNLAAHGPAPEASNPLSRSVTDGTTTDAYRSVTDGTTEASRSAKDGTSVVPQMAPPKCQEWHYRGVTDGTLPVVTSRGNYAEVKAEVTNGDEAGEIVEQRIPANANTSPSLPSASEASFVPLASPGARADAELPSALAAPGASYIVNPDVSKELNRQREIGKIADGHYEACAELRGENRHAACCCRQIDAGMPLSKIALCGHAVDPMRRDGSCIRTPCLNRPDEIAAA